MRNMGVGLLVGRIRARERSSSRIDTKTICEVPLQVAMDSLSFRSRPFLLFSEINLGAGFYAHVGHFFWRVFAGIETSFFHPSDEDLSPGTPAPVGRDAGARAGEG